MVVSCLEGDPVPILDESSTAGKEVWQSHQRDRDICLGYFRSKDQGTGAGAGITGTGTILDLALIVFGLALLVIDAVAPVNHKIYQVTNRRDCLLPSLWSNLRVSDWCRILSRYPTSVGGSSAGGHTQLLSGRPGSLGSDD